MFDRFSHYTRYIILKIKKLEGTTIILQTITLRLCALARDKKSKFLDVTGY